MAAGVLGAVSLAAAVVVREEDGDFAERAEHACRRVAPDLAAKISVADDKEVAAVLRMLADTSSRIGQELKGVELPTQPDRRAAAGDMLNALRTAADEADMLARLAAGEPVVKRGEPDTWVLPSRYQRAEAAAKRVGAPSCAREEVRLAELVPLAERPVDKPRQVQAANRLCSETEDEYVEIIERNAESLGDEAVVRQVADVLRNLRDGLARLPMRPEDLQHLNRYLDRTSLLLEQHDHLGAARRRGDARALEAVAARIDELRQERDTSAGALGWNMCVGLL
ncbi:MAG TPA: hypothetical protein VHF47_00550 [Acidimicrobiales bacterium]|nr:hypothetical protein [Acidimicrobiales bacterium]